ncbi:unnamed protein product [Triticum turgidum subsp. durum]|uniref:Uncharacterized protein n=1 Tax=Triticum turgidum subsp. durum TaxID=4567 RepID=A0A9R1PUG5_TRITD|nr:unnamed protein product [Triticum turgidum subsp. durum]
MDFGTELKGCVCRINNCAIELFSMKEDLEIEDEDSWDLVGRDLRLKATFLYIDLSRVISSCESDERKKMLTGLANKFFYFMDEVMTASFHLFGQTWAQSMPYFIANSHVESYIHKLSGFMYALDYQISQMPQHLKST